MANQRVIEVSSLSFSFDNGNQILDDVSLTVADGDFVWVVGPNGGGKTTLIKLILGLLPPSAGSVKVFGKSPQEARSQIGYMPQHAQIDLRFPVTVLDVALMGRLSKAARFGPYSKEDRSVAVEALSQVGLEGSANKPLSELSGGQLRRLLVARALAAAPKLLILDEPTANLDRVFERELYELLRRLNETLTVIMVSHDPAFVSDFVEDVVCVNRTLSVHPTSAMEGELMDELYGRQVRMVRHDRHHHGDQERSSR
jgi:zinc transport system ATP-binding protein